MVDKVITLSDKPQKHHCTPKMMEPVEQVDPESYIGLAFKQLDKKKQRTDKKCCKRLISSNVSSNSLGDSSGSSLLEDDGLNNSDGHSSDHLLIHFHIVEWDEIIICIVHIPLIKMREAEGPWSRLSSWPQQMTERVSTGPTEVEM